jgi:hypothetical protein
MHSEYILAKLYALVVAQKWYCQHLGLTMGTRAVNLSPAKPHIERPCGVKIHAAKETFFSCSSTDQHHDT